MGLGLSGSAKDSPNRHPADERLRVESCWQAKADLLRELPGDFHKQLRRLLFPAGSVAKTGLLVRVACRTSSCLRGRCWC